MFSNPHWHQVGYTRNLKPERTIYVPEVTCQYYEYFLFYNWLYHTFHPQLKAQNPIHINQFLLSYYNAITINSGRIYLECLNNRTALSIRRLTAGGLKAFGEILCSFILEWENLDFPFKRNCCFIRFVFLKGILK